jgi:hypothetical protein
LAAPYAAEAGRKAIINAVADLENTRIHHLMQLLASICVPSAVEGRKHA